MKISFHSYANKTNFHMKSFALSLAFIVRFTATRKWPIFVSIAQPRSQSTSILSTQPISSMDWVTSHLTARQGGLGMRLCSLESRCSVHVSHGNDWQEKKNNTPNIVIPFSLCGGRNPGGGAKRRQKVRGGGKWGLTPLPLPLSNYGYCPLRVQVKARWKYQRQK